MPSTQRNLTWRRLYYLALGGGGATTQAPRSPEADAMLAQIRQGLQTKMEPGRKAE